MTVRHRDLAVDWLGYATVRAETPGGFVAYLDPGRYGVLTGEWTPWSEAAPHPPATDYDARDGDLVCVTHDHHYDSDGIRRVAGDDATVVVYEAVDAAGIGRDVEPVADLPFETVRVGYGDAVTVGATTVEAVPAYNRPDGPRAGPDGSVGHPRGFGCGYRLSIPAADGTTSDAGGATPGADDAAAIFYPGDSDAVPEHETLDASLFLAPISENLTMGPTEAAELAETLAPELALPVHYNTFERLAGDSRAFAAETASRGVPVVLDER